MAGNVGKVTRQFAMRSKMRQEAIFRQTVQTLAHRSNTPIAQGGKLPVDTGFLRASQAGSRIGMPYGPTKGQRNQVYATPFAGPIELIVAQSNIGDTVWIGWTAEYAIYMEARYGFMRSEAQNWQFIVQQATNEVRIRIP